MLSLTQSDIKYVKGIGPRRADLLASQVGIRTVYDLLCYYPTSYVDRSRIYSIRSLYGAGTELPAVQVKGRFVSFNVLGEGARARLVGLFTDGTATLQCVWFKGIKAIRRKLLVGNEYILFARPTVFNGSLQMSHPEVDTPGTSGAAQGLRGIYPLTERLRSENFGSRAFHSAVSAVLEAHKTPFSDPLPLSVVQNWGLLDFNTAIRAVHIPDSPEQLGKARQRLKFQELFFIQVDMLRRSRARKEEQAGYYMPRVGRWFNDFYSQCLPFELTDAQKRVIKEIRADIISGKQMNRLVQGDVGSGKTLVALMCMLLAVDNGFQACLMAPTEILATQHFATISEMCAKIGLSVRLLTGSTRASERRKIDEALQNGDLHILVGTHAVLEDKVQFKRLGFVVIDEQHRFGVAQRARLWAKSEVPPHVLVMTATPIPRTLAMTVYGDLDVSVIDQLPPGRQPVTTLLRYEDSRDTIDKALKRQLKEGRQVYIVYPLIEENEKLDLKSATEGYERACSLFGEFGVAFVHGRMKPAEKDSQMQLFASGKAGVLVSTTVIEVGVNVPNATIMVVENAERFGLSQLHQLRGRVGRGAHQSFCILVTKSSVSGDTKHRLEILASTSDGFVVAEADMQLRGPGDIEGTAQSGLPFQLNIASLATDGAILAQARKAAEQLLDADPTLSLPENNNLSRALTLLAKRTADWSRIS